MRKATLGPTCCHEVAKSPEARPRSPRKMAAWREDVESKIRCEAAFLHGAPAPVSGGLRTHPY